MVDNAPHTDLSKVKEAIASITDPEIPVLSVYDLGVIHDVKITGETVHIELMPTYSGCPAMDTIATDISLALAEIKYLTKINLILSPPWSTDRITDEGRKKLEEYGIATPLSESADKRALLDGEKIVKCPQCGSTSTGLISQFGSTACKALFKCEDCLEPFDYFKCLK